MGDLFRFSEGIVVADLANRNTCGRSSRQVMAIRTKYHATGQKILDLACFADYGSSIQYPWNQWQVRTVTRPPSQTTAHLENQAKYFQRVT
ncbi:hypothetical protein [Desulfatitalea alkaliphila]|uniref:Uncharacterized protein n=1 Tax=Desulfatitalea alkaliphila TaxID=2929485 RepID=A0AA41R661_9BACT|nr:hypothetical protein [Desulfatitalea alkaliphila]MCJ8503094.1 hypothetical protein [Desulfatitalea alkaliphila]